MMSQGFGKENTHASVMHFYKSYGMLGHNGWDWTAKDGEPIYWDCSSKGIVMDCHIDRNGGWGVRVITSDDNKTGFKHLFWHLKEFKCQAGQTLETGDIIGLADNTGNSTGTHLHRGLKPVKDTNLGWRNAEPNNGYCGGVDIEPVLRRYICIRQNEAVGKEVINTATNGRHSEEINYINEENKMKYSIKKGLLKLVKSFVIFLLPLLVSKFIIAFPDIAQISVGALLVGIANWLKVRYNVRAL